MRKKGIEPFGLIGYDWRDEKEPPFVVIELNVGGGRKAKIPIHETDEPKIIARNYGKVFQLDKSARRMLEELIEDQFEIYQKANDFV